MTSYKKIENSFREERGAALVLALFVITVLTVLGTLVLNTAIVEIKMSRNQKVSSQVFYAAEAGLERGILMLIADFENDTTSGSPWGNSNYPGWGETITESANTGSATFDPAVRTLDMYTDSPDSNLKKLTLTGGNTVGNSSFDLYIYKESTEEAYVLSHATGLDGVAAVEYHLKVEDFSPYNNAIFTGSGVSGHFQGSVNIAGSVYSRGNLDAGPNIKFANNYFTGHHPLSGGDTLYSLLDLVSGADLDTKIRVKGGDFTLGAASTTVGFTGANNAVTGVYVDGSTNIDSVGGPHYYGELTSEVPDVPMPNILDGLRGDHTDTFIDNCIATQGYAGNNAAVAMSLYADLANGAGCWSASDSLGAVHVGDIVLDMNTPSGWLVGPDANNNGIYFDQRAAGPGNGAAGMGRITVQGTAVVTGDFVFGDNKLEGLHYDATGADTGSGSDAADGAALVLGGNFSGTGSFYADNGYLKGAAYPGSNDINSLGVVTPGTVTFDGSNSDVYTGMFFADTQINFNKQAKFGGTVISGHVNYAQVPDVYQVPNLKYYLPPGIPGGQTVVRLSTREWRRVY